MKKGTKPVFAYSALLIATLIWSITFVVVKNALDFIPLLFLVGVRFSIGAIGLLPFVLKGRSHLFHRKLVFNGAVLGVLLFLSFILQTLGLKYTTVGKNAFISAAYVVLVPFFSWSLFKQRPTRRVFIAALICFIGIGVLSLTGLHSGVNVGDGFTFLCSILFAVHIVMVEKYVHEGCDIILLTLLQFAVAGLLGFALGFAFGDVFPTQLNRSQVMSLIYISIFSTLIGLTLQNIGVKYLKGNHASLLLCLESPFGCIAGILLLNEAFTANIAIGGLLIFGAVLIAQPQPEIKVLQPT